MPFFNSVRNFVNSSTELKVKEITDDSETSGKNGNGGTIMNEISVLTYSPKTLKEIISVLRKRLNVCLMLSKKVIHKNCLIVIKTLTLISYLLNNGSNEFISWVKTNSYIFDILSHFEINDSVSKVDTSICNQIQTIAKDVADLLSNSTLLEDRRQNVMEFRSSISSPGRKSTDNSHIQRYSSERYSSERFNHYIDTSVSANGSKSFDFKRRNNNSNVNKGNGVMTSSPLIPWESTDTNLNTSNNNHNHNYNNYSSSRNSNDLSGPIISNNNTKSSLNFNRNNLGPLREEENMDEDYNSSNNNSTYTSIGRTSSFKSGKFNSNNPFL